jgi:hypothetical protein
LNGVHEVGAPEWREIDHVPSMSYSGARIFKKKYDLGSARLMAGS